MSEEQAENEVSIIIPDIPVIFTFDEIARTFSDLCMYNGGYGRPAKFKINAHTISDLLETVRDASKALGCLEEYRKTLEQLKELALKDLMNSKVNDSRKEY